MTNATCPKHADMPCVSCALDAKLAETEAIAPGSSLIVEAICGDERARILNEVVLLVSALRKERMSAWRQEAIPAATRDAIVSVFDDMFLKLRAMMVGNPAFGGATPPLAGQVGEVKKESSHE